MKYKDFEVGDFITNEDNTLVWQVSNSHDAKCLKLASNAAYPSVVSKNYLRFEYASKEQIKKFQAAYKLRTIGVKFSKYGKTYSYIREEGGRVGDKILIKNEFNPDGKWAEIVEIGNSLDATVVANGEIKMQAKNAKVYYGDQYLGEASNVSITNSFKEVESHPKFKVGDILRDSHHTIYEVTQINGNFYHLRLSNSITCGWQISKTEETCIKIGDKDHKYQVGDIAEWHSGTPKETYKIVEITDTGYMYEHKDKAYSHDAKHFEKFTKKLVDKPELTVNIEVGNGAAKAHDDIVERTAAILEKLGDKRIIEEKPKSRIMKFLFG